VSQPTPAPHQTGRADFPHPAFRDRQASPGPFGTVPSSTSERGLHAHRPERGKVEPLAKTGVHWRAGPGDFDIRSGIVDVGQVGEHGEALEKIVFPADIERAPRWRPVVGAGFDAGAGGDRVVAAASAIIPLGPQVVALTGEAGAPVVGARREAGEVREFIAERALDARRTRLTTPSTHSRT